MPWAGWIVPNPVPVTAAMLAPANARASFPRYSSAGDWNQGVGGNDMDTKATSPAVGSESVNATGLPAAVTRVAFLAARNPAMATGSDIGQDYGAYDNYTGRSGFIGPRDPYPDATTPTMVMSINPGTGGIAGGTVVTISGLGFTGTTGVTFGGTAGTNIVVGSNNMLTVQAPAKAAGSYDVVVTSPKGVSQSGVKYTYV